MSIGIPKFRACPSVGGVRMLLASPIFAVQQKLWCWNDVKSVPIQLLLSFAARVKRPCIRLEAARSLCLTGMVCSWIVWCFWNGLLCLLQLIFNLYWHVTDVVVQCGICAEFAQNYSKDVKDMLEERCYMKLCLDNLWKIDRIHTRSKKYKITLCMFYCFALSACLYGNCFVVVRVLYLFLCCYSYVVRHICLFSAAVRSCYIADAAIIVYVTVNHRDARAHGCLPQKRCCVVKHHAG